MRAFTFGEAEIWVRPTGLNSQSVGFASSYSLDRSPVGLEDGAAAFYEDELTITSPWVDADVTTIFEAAGPFDAFVRWRNEDDGRLESASIVGGRLVRSSKRPTAGVETFEFTFAARGLR